jgi:hypothetical protein
MWMPGAHPPGTIIDMSGITFRLRNSSNPNPNGICRYTGANQIPTNPYPVENAEGNNRSTVDACFRGGRVVGEVSPTADRRIWDTQPGGYCNSAAVFMKNWASTRQKVQATRVDRAWDGFRMGSGNCRNVPGLCHNLIRTVWVSNVRDDCVENDFMGGLTIQDSLFDSCFSGISSDPGNCTNCASHHSTDTIQLDGVLLKVQGFPDTYGGSLGLHHLGPFKINARLGPQLVVNNSIIALTNDDPARYDRWRTGWAKIKSCYNNQFLWLPDAPFPPTSTFPKPPPCFTIKTGAAARTIWNQARTAWIARHPEVARVAGDPQ